jgi:hypothetical protein
MKGLLKGPKDTPASEVMEPQYNYKGKGPVSATFATGGEVITSNSRFMKAQDVYRTNIERNSYGKSGKGGEMSEVSGDTKSETPIKPRK